MGWGRARGGGGNNELTRKAEIAMPEPLAVDRAWEI